MAESHTCTKRENMRTKQARSKFSCWGISSDVVLLCEVEQMVAHTMFPAAEAGPQGPSLRSHFEWQTSSGRRITALHQTAWWLAVTKQTHSTAINHSWGHCPCFVLPPALQDWFLSYTCSDHMSQLYVSPHTYTESTESKQKVLGLLKIWTLIVCTKCGQLKSMLSPSPAVLEHNKDNLIYLHKYQKVNLLFIMKRMNMWQ